MTRTASNVPGMKVWLGALFAAITFILNSQVIHTYVWLETAINAIAVAIAVYEGYPQPTIDNPRGKSRPYAKG